MVSQEQATLSSGIISVLVGYLLWSLLQAGTFVPYDAVGNPQFTNILAFMMLVSILVSALTVVLVALVSNVNARIVKSEKRLESTALGILGLAVWAHIAIFLVLHVFHLFPWWGTLLSYTVFWGIVIYGRFKDKNRLKKYLATGDRARENQKTIEIRGK